MKVTAGEIVFRFNGMIDFPFIEEFSINEIGTSEWLTFGKLIDDSVKTSLGNLSGNLLKSYLEIDLEIY